MKRLNYYRLYNRFQSVYTYFHYNFGRGRAFLPLRYNMHLTYRCNLRCPFCYIGNPEKQEELDTESWLRFLDGVPRLSLLSYSGGEITLRPDFKTILRKSLDTGRVTFLTNGTLMDEEIIDISVRRGLFLMGVSIDGLEEKHDTVRGAKGTFQKAVSVIEALQEKKGRKKHPIIDIKTVILDHNLGQLLDLYRMADSLKVDFFTLSFLKGCSLQFNPMLKEVFSEEFYAREYSTARYFDMDAFKDVYRQLLDFSKRTDTQMRFYPEFHHARGEAELRKIEYFYGKGCNSKPRDIYYRCLYPWTELSIAPNGDCFPCLSYKVGNITDGSIAELWNNERYTEFRRRLQKAGMFNSCQGCCYSRMR